MSLPRAVGRLGVGSGLACLLVYYDEAIARRNNIREKIERLGVVVRDEADSGVAERMEMSQYALVVIIIDGINRERADRIVTAARYAGATAFRVPHQTSKPAWREIEAWVQRHSPPALTIVKPPTPEPVGDDTFRELADSYAVEADAARSELETVRGERDALAKDLANARSDRERLTKERDALAGKVDDAAKLMVAQARCEKALARIDGVK